MAGSRIVRQRHMHPVCVALQPTSGTAYRSDVGWMRDKELRGRRHILCAGGLTACGACVSWRVCLSGPQPHLPGLGNDPLTTWDLLRWGGSGV